MLADAQVSNDLLNSMFTSLACFSSLVTLTWFVTLQLLTLHHLFPDWGDWGRYQHGTTSLFPAVNGVAKMFHCGFCVDQLKGLLKDGAHLLSICLWVVV